MKIPFLGNDSENNMVSSVGAPYWMNVPPMQALKSPPKRGIIPDSSHARSNVSSTW